MYSYRLRVFVLFGIFYVLLITLVVVQGADSQVVSDSTNRDQVDLDGTISPERLHVLLDEAHQRLLEVQNSETLGRMEQYSILKDMDQRIGLIDQSLGQLRKKIQSLEGKLELQQNGIILPNVLNYAEL